MRLGWTLSWIGHGGLVFVLLFGGLFSGDRIPEPMNVADVTVISEAEFAALVLPGASPLPQTEAPDVAPAPDGEDAPIAPAASIAPQRTQADAVQEAQQPDTSDIEVPEPLPDAVVVDEAPTLALAPAEQDGTSLERDVVAAPAPRVAALPQVAPPPDSERAPDFVPDQAPEPLPEADPQPDPEEAAAPEAASDRIVTEAEEEKTYAPASSKRPRSRPARATAEETAPAEPSPQPTAPAAQPSTDDAVAAALGESQSEAPAPSGPPLTGGEKEGLRVAISRCWNVGSLSTDALGTTVIVAVEMERTGTPVAGSIRMVQFSGGSEAGARQAFEAARRAIIRCGARGFPLPPEKFAEWRDIEMTFNPEGMQFR